MSEGTSTLWNARKHYNSLIVTSESKQGTLFRTLPFSIRLYPENLLLLLIVKTHIHGDPGGQPGHPKTGGRHQDAQIAGNVQAGE